jgi:predicted 2-oxoglutarate/Fe(II)-dependent dioxygenase YbiX
MSRSSPSVGHHWHYDGARPEGVTQAELDANYSEPWKNKKLVDNHAAMNAFTSILLLSDPSSYSGGELNIYDEVNDTILKFRENHYLGLLIFPSKDTYQHMVTPITSGERFSHIAWYKEI